MIGHHPRLTALSHALLTLLLAFPALADTNPAAILQQSVAAQQVASQQWLIQDTTIISPEHSAPLTHQDILFSANGIERIGSQLPPGKAQVIDGRGRFVIPGLIDSHVHLGSNAGLDDDQQIAQAHLVAQFLAQEPRSYLYFGFTTVVDLKQSEPFAQQWQSLPLKPDLLYCKGLPFANGYGMAFVPEAERFANPYFLYDPTQPSQVPNTVDVRQHSPKQVIAKVKQTQASCVKTFNEDGFGGLWHWPTPSDALIAEVHQLAKQQQLVHVHHANSLAAQRQAVAANVDVIGHGLWHWQALNNQPQLPDAIRTLLDGVLAQGIGYQATARVLGGEVDLYDPQFLQQANLSHSLPAELLKWHQQGHSTWFTALMDKRIREHPAIVEQFLGHPATGAVAETSKRALVRLGQVVRYLAEHDGNLLLASDTPSSPTYTNPPGLNGLLELYQLQQFGVSLPQLLKAATLNNAQAFGIADRVGTVSVGKQADLLVLTRNPWQDISAYDHIEWVVSHGQPIARATLSALTLPDLAKP